MTNTDITLLAILSMMFTEITKKLATPTEITVGSIVDNGTDTFHELFLTHLIHLFRDDNHLGIYAVTGIGDVRSLTLRNEMDNVALTQIL